MDPYLIACLTHAAAFALGYFLRMIRR